MFRSILVVLFLACSTPSFAGYINYQFTMQNEIDNSIWALVVPVNEGWHQASRSFDRYDGGEYLVDGARGHYLEQDFGSRFGDVYGLFSTGRVDYSVLGDLRFDEGAKLDSMGLQLYYKNPPDLGWNEMFFSIPYGFSDFRYFEEKDGWDFDRSTILSTAVIQDSESSVPEPASFGLLGISLLGFLGVRKWFSKSPNLLTY